MNDALQLGPWMKDWRVSILAPGPNGKPFWGKLPKGMKIVINKGIEIPIYCNFWLVTDWWALKTKWFFEHLHSYGGRYIFSEGLYSKLPEYTHEPYIYDPLIVKLVDGRDCITPLGTGPFVDVPGRLRPDGTVAASAVELAVKCGAKEVVLCGVDMEGDKYYDDNECISTTCDHQGEWAYTPYFNSLIQWAKGKGVDVWSLSKTTLDVEVRGGN